MKLNIDLSKIPKKSWVLICVFLILAICAFSYNIVFYPMLSKIKDLSVQVQQRKRIIQKAEVDPEYFGDLSSEIELLKSTMKTYQQELMALTEVPQILKELNQIAAGLDIKFVSVDPLEREKLMLPGAREQLLRFPIKVKLQCGYHQLGVFINRIESSAQFMQISDLKISLDSRDIWTHQVELVITNFGWGSTRADKSEI
ncbi:type 4a pilus biogenesis protein PilO [Candidatus Omnitrophota bacterium]